MREGRIQAIRIPKKAGWVWHSSPGMPASGKQRQGIPIASRLARVSEMVSSGFNGRWNLYVVGIEETSFKISSLSSYLGREQKFENNTS